MNDNNKGVGEIKWSVQSLVHSRWSLNMNSWSCLEIGNLKENIDYVGIELVNYEENNLKFAKIDLDNFTGLL